MKYLLITICLLSYLFSSCQSKYFDHAESMIKKYKPKRTDYVIVVDYTKNIMLNRLYVLDMKNKEVIIESTVSHAWKSGALYPSDYSNQIGSDKTSKGCFMTLGTKYGGFGYSMIIKGLDKGINDNAMRRSVIFHSDTKMKTKWSRGCFATPESTNKKIIDLTKNGCLVCVID